VDPDPSDVAALRESPYCGDYPVLDFARNIVELERERRKAKAG